MNKILESKMKVRFHDCDPFNHLNNARYIDYMMASRTDQLLDNYGLDVHQLAFEKKIGWVSAQTQISYIIPAALSETVNIQTRLLGFSEKSLLFEALMWNRNNTALKAVMWAKLVHFNIGTQRSHTHTTDLMTLFEQVVNPVETGTSFEERTKQLKQTI